MSRKEQDLELWKKWKKSGSQDDLKALLRQTDGLMQTEVNRWSGVLARDILELEAARLAKQAFTTFDPSQGASLGTHVTNSLKKLSRQVYTHQNLARLPEYQTLKIRTYSGAVDALKDNLGREPTISELSNHLAWSQAAVENMRKQLKKEQIESVGAQAMPVMGRTSSDVLVDLVYHDLSPLQKSIFEHTTGYGGSPVLQGKELLKKLNLTQGQLSYEKKKIVNRVKSVSKP